MYKIKQKYVEEIETEIVMVQIVNICLKNPKISAKL